MKKMKKNIINMTFKLNGDKPSQLSFGGNESEDDAISDMEICNAIVRDASRKPGMEWIILDVVETDGFYFRLRTTITGGQATTEFGVPGECSNPDRVTERLAQFKEIFEGNGARAAMLH